MKLTCYSHEWYLVDPYYELFITQSIWQVEPIKMKIFSKETSAQNMMTIIYNKEKDIQQYIWIISPSDFLSKPIYIYIQGEMKIFHKYKFQRFSFDKLVLSCAKLSRVRFCMVLSIKCFTKFQTFLVFPLSYIYSLCCTFIQETW